MERSRRINGCNAPRLEMFESERSNALEQIVTNVHGKGHGSFTFMSFKVERLTVCQFLNVYRVHRLNVS